MSITFDRLWQEYLSECCSKITTEEQRKLAKKAVELHETAAAMLNSAQEEAVEKYVDALCDIDAQFMKSAFFQGCEFALSLLLELGFTAK